MSTKIEIIPHQEHVKEMKQIADKGIVKLDSPLWALSCALINHKAQLAPKAVPVSELVPAGEADRPDEKPECIGTSFVINMEDALSFREYHLLGEMTNENGPFQEVRQYNEKSNVIIGGFKKGQSYTM